MSEAGGNPQAMHEQTEEGKDGNSILQVNGFDILVSVRVDPNPEDNPAVLLRIRKLRIGSYFNNPASDHHRHSDKLPIDFHSGLLFLFLFCEFVVRFHAFVGEIEIVVQAWDSVEENSEDIV